MSELGNTAAESPGCLLSVRRSWRQLAEEDPDLLASNLQRLEGSLFDDDAESDTFSHRSMLNAQYKQWFRAVRYRPASLSLKEALAQAENWYKRTRSLEAQYYMTVLRIMLELQRPTASRQHVEAIHLLQKQLREHAEELGRNVNTYVHICVPLPRCHRSLG